MTRFDVTRIKQHAQDNYEEAWIQSAQLLPKTGKYYTLLPQGESHPVFDCIYRIRSLFLQLGFQEVMLPTIIDEREVLRQYGPEGYVILDRVYYLAGLPRPDIGISQEIQQSLHQIVPQLNIAKLQELFRLYKKGSIEADNLLETMVTQLQLREEVAAKILTFFPEFQQMAPIATPWTLRSHTTAAWFPALQHFVTRQQLPLQLFSIGKKYRREQKIDASHLFESWTASLVIMSETISLEDTQRIITDLFQQLGHASIKCTIKQATSKYYAPQTEYEVFIRHPTTHEFLEVGDGGFYSPVSLAQYDIPSPVFNFGLGIERLIMIEQNFTDIRHLVYPYQYTSTEYTDSEIASDLTLINAPQHGATLVKTITQKAQDHAHDPSPTQVIVYNDSYLGRHVTIRLVENEAEKLLLGPAAFNHLVVKNGNILGVPANTMPSNATHTRWTYMDGVAHWVVHAIENAIANDTPHLTLRVRLVKRLADINLTMSDAMRRYIEAKQAKIDVRGPLFAEFQVDIG